MMRSRILFLTAMGLAILGIAFFLLRFSNSVQLTGTVVLQHITEGGPVEGRCASLTEAGQRLRGKFRAEWGNRILLWFMEPWGRIQPMENQSHRQLSLSDLESMAQVLAQSFSDDPLVSFILPNGRTRVKTIAKFFRAMGRLNLRAGSAFGVSDPLEGVAVWSFPNQPEASASPKDLLSFLPVLFSSYSTGARRARPIFQQIDANRKKHAPDPHFYLDNLGVLASARGRGLSSKLIRPFLDMADEQNVTAYTDTAAESNVPLYEHFGFECVERNPVESTGITVYALKRTPR